MRNFMIPNMNYRTLLVLFILMLALFAPEHTIAQCAMCKANAESSLKEGNDTARGLNMGIMYLLVIPYLAIGAIGYWWYLRNKKSRASEE
jgi:hypothetical protein